MVFEEESGKIQENVSTQKLAVIRIQYCISILQQLFVLSLICYIFRLITFLVLGLYPEAVQVGVVFSLMSLYVCIMEMYCISAQLRKESLLSQRRRLCG